MGSVLGLISSDDPEVAHKESVARASFMWIVIRPSLLLLYIFFTYNGYKNYTGNFSYIPSRNDSSVCYITEKMNFCLNTAINEQYTVVKDGDRCDSYVVPGRSDLAPITSDRFEEISNEDFTASLYFFIDIGITVVQSIYVIVFPTMFFLQIPLLPIEYLFEKMTSNISGFYLYHLLFILCFLPNKIYGCYMLPDLSFEFAVDLSPGELRNVISYSSIILFLSAVAGWVSESKKLRDWTLARKILWYAFFVLINFTTPFFLFPITILFSSAYSSFTGDGSSISVEGIVIAAAVAEFNLMAVPTHIPEDDSHYWYRRWVLKQEKDTKASPFTKLDEHA